MRFLGKVGFRGSLLLFLVCLVVKANTAVAAQPGWADQNLPVKDGLQLWLDASRLVDNNALPIGGQIAEWPDASGNDRTVKQPNFKLQPMLIKKGKVGLLRFDGIDDHLRVEKLGLSLKSLTVIVELVPRNNIGGFRGIVSTNKHNSRDYQTGINLDFGPHPSGDFSYLNIEGRGLAGVTNLRTRKNRFGKLQTIEVTSNVADKKLQVTIDGKAEGSRPMNGDALSFDELTVGARFYSNDDQPHHAQGFAHFDLAEMLVYDRELTSVELKSVRKYLNGKYSQLKDDLPPDSFGGGDLLKPVNNPPTVQVFVPGFSVKELPLDLLNVNNIKYRHDGVLVALCYNGDIYLLRDTDNDGLEDKADLFWKNDGKTSMPIGFDLAPAGYKHGNGVLVASRGKVSLFADTNNDDKADKEIIVASDWKMLEHRVDALSVTVDQGDGSVYFGRGTFDFTDAYILRGTDKPQYDIAAETGTIQKVDPDFKARKIIATGIRFPVGTRLNRFGDLFCTDQEGATWLPNGNPLDELLHIQWGQDSDKTRHYGFPPRHPQHLPNVIDEPSTFDYGPQHQSLCGFNFNEPVKKDGPTFGPATWADNALVTGYSRGKLYRTELVRNEQTKQYTARTSLFACANMLTVDACVSPVGDMVISCHSGGPDWGSGPTGKGKLYKIIYTDKEHPQPAVVWPASKNEVRVEFDRPVDPAMLADVVNQSKLTAGKWVRAGDRFESLWPGYAIVMLEKSTPRYDVPIRSAQLTPDRRTLVLSTDAHDAAVHYGLQLSGMGRSAVSNMPPGTKRQEPQIDLDLDLSGCDATWKSADGKTEWTGWLPHIDLQVAKQLTRGSAYHDQLWDAMQRPGELTIKAQLDLFSMLRPALQPGTKIGFELPPEKVTLVFYGGDSKLTVISPNSKSEAKPATKVAVSFEPQKSQLIPIEIRLQTKQMPQLTVMFNTNEQADIERTVGLHRVLVPWAQLKVDSLDFSPSPTKIAELEGGSWASGRKIFYGEQANCSKCHALHGLGGSIGPDLSNLIHRDYASVLRDITQPSFAINPDHLSYVVQLKDGRTLTGVLKNHGDKHQIGDAKGELIEVTADDIEEKKPSPTSIMPEGIPKLLGPEKMRDLLTFLLMPPPQMPHDYQGARPKLRTMSEVQAMLRGAPAPAEITRQLRVVLVDGKKDHGPGEHDYPAWSKMWSELMAAGDKVDVATAHDWPDKKVFQTADVMVFFQRGNWNKERAADIDAFLARGGGLVYIHWAVDGQKEAPEFAKRIGLSWGAGAKFRHGPLDLVFNQETRHPVARNFVSLSIFDESYWSLQGKLPADRVIATGAEENNPQPLFWSLEQGKGRVFVSIPGHFSWTFDDPLFRILLLRGIAWSANEPVDRFNDLVLPGAEVQK